MLITLFNMNVILLQLNGYKQHWKTTRIIQFAVNISSNNPRDKSNSFFRALPSNWLPITNCIELSLLFVEMSR